MINIDKCLHCKGDKPKHRYLCDDCWKLTDDRTELIKKKERRYMTTDESRIYFESADGAVAKAMRALSENRDAQLNFLIKELVKFKDKNYEKESSCPVCDDKILQNDESCCFTCERHVCKQCIGQTRKVPGNSVGMTTVYTFCNDCLGRDTDLLRDRK
jgi:hypothetical protein